MATGKYLVSYIYAVVAYNVWWRIGINDNIIRRVMVRLFLRRIVLK
jgi:hypothetical protein